MKTVLFVLDNYFPYGTAASSRARSLCKLFLMSGYEVHVICSRTPTPSVDTTAFFKLPYCTYKVSSSREESSLNSFVGTPELMRDVRVYLKSNTPNVVFAMNSLTFFEELQKICKKNNLKLIVEQNEWRDTSSFKLGKFDFRYLREEWLITKEYKKANGILAITKYFQNHYLGMGVNTVRIPTILDTVNLPYSFHGKNNKIKIIYTGNPSTSKEFLKPMIDVLIQYPRMRQFLEFHIYGPDYGKVVKNIGGNSNLLDELEKNVFIHGRIGQEQIQKVIMESDYQLFLRPCRRSSEAGFPTKLGESMSVGTPVISNVTGDIGLYLQDEENGYIVKDFSTESLHVVLEKAINLDEEKYKLMREKARKTAEKSFDYRNYTDEVKNLFEG